MSKVFLSLPRTGSKETKAKTTTSEPAWDLGFLTRDTGVPLR